MNRIISAAIGCLVVLAALAGGCWAQRHEAQATRPSDYRVRQQAVASVSTTEKIVAATPPAAPAQHPSTPEIPTFMRVYAEDAVTTDELSAQPAMPKTHTRARRLPPVVTLPAEAHNTPPATQLARVTLSLPFAESDDQAELALVEAVAPEPAIALGSTTSFARRSLQKPVVKSKRENVSPMSPLLSARHETIATTPSLIPATVMQPTLESTVDTLPSVATIPPPPVAAVLTKPEPIVAMVPAARAAEVLPIVPTVNRQTEADLWRLAPNSRRAMPITIRYADEPQLSPAPRKLLFPRIQNTSIRSVISKRATAPLAPRTPLSMLPKHMRTKNSATQKSGREGEDEMWVKAAWGEPSLDYTAPPLATGLGLFQK